MHFRPSFALSLTLITLAAVFLRLGLWQLERKAEKIDLFQRFDNAPSMRIEEALDGAAEFARIQAFGRYDEQRHVLLDNRVWQGRAGVHALTPFELTDGRWLLVNRGWLPLPPDRLSLPEVPTDSATRSIHGRIVSPVTGAPRLGPADVLVSDRWPQLITYLNLMDVGAALSEKLEPWIVQLDANDPSGFGDRQWSAAVMTPATHAAYAVQWLALCATALVIWIALGLRRGAQLAAQNESAKRPATGESQQ